MNIAGNEFADRKLPGRGINLLSGELKPEGKKAIYGKDYVYPPPQELDYYAGKGFAVVRYRIDGCGCSRRYSGKLDPAVTDAVLDEVAEWQNRPLDICHPLVFFDAIRVKIRDEGFVRNKAIYIALGILPEGTKEILGHFSANDRSDLHRSPDPPFHGFCLLEGSQEAQALRAIYRAADAEAGQAALDAFAQGPWGGKYPAIAQSWRRNWDLVIPFFALRSTKCRRNADQPDLSSLAPSQMPKISRKPSELTALATSSETLRTSPAQVRFITMPSR